MDALTRGFSFYLADETGDRYRQLFTRMYECTEDEIDSIRRYFAQHPPKVNEGYPRDDIGKSPAIFVVLSSESQPTFALNNFAGVGAPPGVNPQAAGQGGAFANTFVRASLWQVQYQILILARGAGPMPVTWTYVVCKAIILAAKRYLEKKGLQSVALSGSDISFRQDLAPSDLYARSLNVQFQREFAVSDDSNLFEKALSVGGLVLPVLSGEDDGRPLSGITVTPKTDA